MSDVMYFNYNLIIWQAEEGVIKASTIKLTDEELKSLQVSIIKDDKVIIWLIVSSKFICVYSVQN